jgi:hypothetical protein
VVEKVEKVERVSFVLFTLDCCGYRLSFGLIVSQLIKDEGRQGL